MMDFFQRKASDRELRLFACACCRRIWRLLTAVDAEDGEWPCLRRKVELGEKYADGLATRKQLQEEYDNDSTFCAETLAAMWTVYTARRGRKVPLPESLLCATNASQLAAFAAARPNQ